MGRGPEGAARLGWDLVGSWELVGSPRRKYPGARGLGGFGIRAGRCMVGCNRNMRLDSKVYLKKKSQQIPSFYFIFILQIRIWEIFMGMQFFF